jgi:hypothetical protein
MEEVLSLRSIDTDMNSGHMKTEEFRTGFFGPYALVFTSGM